MIWEIEYDNRKKRGYLLSYMNKDKQMIKCCGGHFLLHKIVMSYLDYTRRTHD